MTEDEVVQRIIRLYKDENGFLVKLRVGIEFDEQLYQESVQTIKDYISLAKGKEYISRHVAFFLYETVFVLEGQAQYFRQINHPLAERTAQAWKEVDRLSQKLFL